MLDLGGEREWEGGKKCSKTCVCGKKRAVTGDECGGGEKGKMKLEWFVGKANWDGVKAEKCVVVDGILALL